MFVRATGADYITPPRVAQVDDLVQYAADGSSLWEAETRRRSQTPSGIFRRQDRSLVAHIARHAI